MRDYIVTDKHVLFWGSKFSNFYPVKIEIGDVTYRSSEQYFMAQKAVETSKKYSIESVYEQWMNNLNKLQQL